MSIRNSAKAIIIQGSKLLTIKKQDEDGYYYILPGGGQEHGENLHQALKRECIEEVNAHVEVNDLLFIREYIGKNHEHVKFDADVHQMEFMFLCDIKEETEDIRNGSVPDEGQVGIEWLEMSELLSYRLYPQTVRQKIMDYIVGKEHPVYLGDIN